MDKAVVKRNTEAEGKLPAEAGESSRVHHEGDSNELPEQKNPHEGSKQDDNQSLYHLDGQHPRKKLANPSVSPGGATTNPLVLLDGDEEDIPKVEAQESRVDHSFGVVTASPELDTHGPAELRSSTDLTRHRGGFRKESSSCTMETNDLHRELDSLLWFDTKWQST